MKKPKSYKFKAKLISCDGLMKVIESQYPSVPIIRTALQRTINPWEFSAINDEPRTAMFAQREYEFQGEQVQSGNIVTFVYKERF